MNGHGGPAMPPGRLTAELHQAAQQLDSAKQDTRADSRAGSPARTPTQPSSRRNSAPAPPPAHGDAAGPRQQTPPWTQPGAGADTPSRQRTPRPAPALYVPPQLRRATLHGAQQPASQPLASSSGGGSLDAGTGFMAPDRSSGSAATPDAGAAASPNSSRRYSEPAATIDGASAVSEPGDDVAAAGAATVSGSASPAAPTTASRQPPQQQRSAPRAAQRQTNQQQQASPAATADKAQQTEGPDSLSAAALESHRQTFIASASAGIPLCALGPAAIGSYLLSHGNITTAPHSDRAPADAC
jgi:hypothetical protein